MGINFYYDKLQNFSLLYEWVEGVQFAEKPIEVGQDRCLTKYVIPPVPPVSRLLYTRYYLIASVDYPDPH